MSSMLGATSMPEAGAPVGVDLWRRSAQLARRCVRESSDRRCCPSLCESFCTEVVDNLFSPLAMMGMHSSPDGILFSARWSEGCNECGESSMATGPLATFFFVENL